METDSAFPAPPLHLYASLRVVEAVSDDLPEIYEPKRYQW